MIHPTAVIHPKARLDSTVRVGPFAVIDEGVELGAECIIGPYVYLTGLTTIGARNHFFAGCIIGEAPQDLKYDNQPTRLRIGDDTGFRIDPVARRPACPDRSGEVGKSVGISFLCEQTAGSIQNPG